MSSIKYWDQTANGGNGAWKYLAQGVKGDTGAPGEKGDQGEVGPRGVSVPAGGLEKQILGKRTSFDYEFEWVSLPTSPVTSVDNKTGAVSLTDSYDAKGIAARKAKLALMLANTKAPQDTKALFNASLTPTVVTLVTSSNRVLNVSQNATTGIITLSVTGSLNGGSFASISVGRFISLTGVATANTTLNTVLNSTNGYVVLSRSDTTLTLSPPSTILTTLTGTQSTGTVSITLRNTNYASDYMSVKDGYALTLAKAPTCTLSAVSTNPYGNPPTNAISINYTDATAFTYAGLVPLEITNSETTNNTYYANNSTSRIDKERAPYWVEFDYYGSDFAIRFNAPYATRTTDPFVDSNTSRVWIWVNGVPVTPEVVKLEIPTAQREYFYRVQWASDDSAVHSFRRIRIMLHNMDFGGIYTQTSSAVTAVNPRPFKVALIDGSWGAGGSGLVYDTAAYLLPILGESLNSDYYGCSIPSTGYVGTDGGPNWADATRLNIIANAAGTGINPDLIIILGSTNDDGLNVTAIQNNATSLYNHFKTYLPNTPIVVFARQSNMVSGTSQSANNAAVMLAASQASNVILSISPYSEGWINSNIDNYFEASDAHPNARGNLYYATRMYSNIIKALNNYLAS